MPQPSRRPPVVLRCLVLALSMLVGTAAVRPFNPNLATRDVQGPAPETAADIFVRGMDKGSVALRAGEIPFVLKSLRDYSIVIDLAVDVQAHGTRTRVDLGDHTLDAGASERLRIRVADLGIDPDTLDSPANLTFRALTHDAAGNAIDGIVSPSLYLHEDRLGKLLLYDEKHLLNRFNGGFISEQLKRADGQRFPGAVNISAGVGHGDPDPDADMPVFTSGLHTVCIHWNYQSRDHFAGELYYAQGEPMAARGVKFFAAQVQGAQGKSYYANKTTGCQAIPLEAGKLTKVTVFSEAVIGSNDNVRVRAFETPSLVTKKNLTLNDLKKWSFYLVPQFGQPSHLHVPSGKSSTLMANGSFAAFRLDQEAPLIQTNLKLNMVRQSNSTNSGADDDQVNVGDPEAQEDKLKSQIDRKFMYGHEVGHWYNLNQGIKFDGGYDYQSPVTPCWSKGFDGPEELMHLMRGSELSSAAMKEGLVHFYSTLIWNGRGRPAPRFRYYKSMDLSGYASVTDAQNAAYADFPENNNLIDMAASTASPLGGDRAWRDSKCFGDDIQKFSVELDWARFFTNYLDGHIWWGDEGYPVPTTAELILLLQIAYTVFDEPDEGDEEDEDLYKTYRHLHQAVVFEHSEFEDRFERFARRYGVDLSVEG